MKDPGVFFRHSLDCIERILAYTSGGRDEFMSSGLIQDAVIRNLQVMCESVSRVPEDIQAGHPGIEWRGISGSSTSWCTIISVWMSNWSGRSSRYACPH